MLMLSKPIFISLQCVFSTIHVWAEPPCKCNIKYLIPYGG